MWGRFTTSELNIRICLVKLTHKPISVVFMYTKDLTIYKNHPVGNFKRKHKTINAKLR